MDKGIYHLLDDPELFQLQSTEMTIVFWDISSFSDLCNTLMNEPITIAGFLRDFFDIAIRTINGYGGIVDKFIGDGILAYFGLGIVDKFTHAENAVNAALDLKQEFDKVRDRWAKIWKNDFFHNEINLGLKCGIHHGDVLFGLLNTDTRSQITIIGENVNFTSRLENEAYGEQIIVSQEIKDLITNKFVINIVKNEPIKSYPEITELYSVDGKLDGKL